jgi:hypothetical protein
MFKTFIAGILLGAAGAAAVLHYVPAVNQSREQSMIVVHPNHGNTESFHVNVPVDRIMVGAPGQEQPLPVGLQWPDDGLFATARAELFKIRNSQDTVVGIASRIAGNDEVSGDIVEWTLHLPARGSAYVVMEAEPREQGYRMGELVAGTREYAPLAGRVTERWVADSSGLEDAPAGRIEIITAFVARELEGE